MGQQHSPSHRYSFSQTPVANPKAIVGGTGKYRFTVLTDGLLRMEWADDGCFEDRASVLAINRDLPVPEFRVEEDDQYTEIITSRFHLTYDRKEFSPSGLSASIKAKMGCHTSVWRYGEQDMGNLGGTARTLDEANGRIPFEPGIMSTSGYAVLDDSPSMLFDASGWLATRRPGNRLDVYLFAYGTEYREAIKAFYALSGPQPLIPRWSLGNWWCRYWAYSADEYLELMDGFQKKDIPMSVGVLDMDWHIVQGPQVTKAGVSGWTGYTWEKKLFPDPEGFLAEMHRRNLKTSLNDHPADGVYCYEEPYNDMAKALGRDPAKGDPIGFDITDRAFADAFFDVLHRRFEDQGIDFWWVDWQQGRYSRVPGIDPLWVLNHYHFWDNSFGGKRPITFSRYAGPGCHRYPIGFSGDTVVTWDSLHFQPEFTATASNIGFGWWSHDIGGHYHGVKDDEMLMRWVQLGVFSPVNRLHSSNSPWSIKEPWNLDLPYELIMSDYLRLRHRLIPYLYTMNVRAATEGLPLVQPMYWGYPDRQEAYQVPNQYFFGSELIVVPITTPQDTKIRRAIVKAWFPPGRYVDIFTGAVYDGDRELYVCRSMSEYPVFAPVGAIVPLDAARAPANGCSDPGGLELLVVVGADGQFELVEDDGVGQDVSQVKFRRTPIIYSQKTGELAIGPMQGGNTTAASSRRWTVRLLGCSSVKNQRLSVNGSTEQSVPTKQASNGLVLELGKHSVQDKLVVKLGNDVALDIVSPVTRVRPFLTNAQIEPTTKDAILSIIKKETPRAVQVGELVTLNLDAPLLHNVLEPLLADTRVLSA